MLSSNESVSHPPHDPINNIGQSYFKHRDASKLRQKNQERNISFSLSVAVFGGPSCGKKTILSTECAMMDEYSNKSMINGVGIPIYEIGEHTIRLNYYVAPGSEIHLQQSSKLLTGFPAAIFVFDVNNEHGLDYLDEWLDYTCPKREYNFVPKKFMIGNKIDTPGHRVILSETANQFATMNNLQYYETCAYDRTKVNNVFKEIGKHLVEMAIASASPLPKFETRLLPIGTRKASFLARFEGSFSRKKHDYDDSHIEKSVGSMTPEDSYDLLKPLDSKSKQRSSILDSTFLGFSKEESQELFYSYYCQAGVSLPRKIRIFQRQQQIKDSASANEGTLVFDWM